MFESPPVDLAVLRRLDSTQVDHTNQGDSFLRVRSDVNAVATAAADEIEVLRSVVRLLVEGVSATCAEVHVGRRKSPWVPVSDAEFAAVDRALGNGRCSTCQGESVIGICSAHRTRDDGCETCDRPMACPACNGSEPLPCVRCEGTGKHESMHPAWDEDPCRECGGTGLDNGSSGESA